MNKQILIPLFLLLSILTLNTNASAVHYVRTKVCGEVKSINKTEKIIAFYLPKNGDTLVLRVGNLTRFIKNDHHVPFEDLVIGYKGEITYKSPLFTDKYLVIYRWSSNDTINSNVCK